MITENIILNLWKENNISIFACCGEVDSRTLIVSFSHEDENFNLSDKSVTFYAKKPDNTKIFNYCTINPTDNTVSITLTSQIVSAVGIVKCEFQIFDSDNNLLKVGGLQIVVLATSDFSSAIESTSEYNTLISAINKAENLNSTALQGVSIDGTPLQKDSGNNVNISSSSLTSDTVKGVSIDGTLLEKDSSNNVNILSSSLNIDAVKGVSIDGTPLQKDSSNNVNILSSSLNIDAVKGVSIDGTPLQKDSSNNVNILSSSLTSDTVKGVSIDGTPLEKDSNNVINILSSSLGGLGFTYGTWSPYLTVSNLATGTEPTYTMSYNNAFYVKIGPLCYISFHFVAKITAAGSGYARIKQLPFPSIVNGGSDYQALSLIESEGLSAACDVAAIQDNSTSIDLKCNYGADRISWKAGTTYLGFSGWYMTNT